MSNVNLGVATYSVIIKQTGVRQFQEEQKKITTSMYLTRRALSVATGMIIADVLRMGSAIITENVALASSFNQLSLTFDNLSRSSSINLSQLQNATMGIVSNIDLLKSANEALLRGIPTDKLAEMFNIGATLAISKGMTASEGINAIVDGVGKMREEYLKNIGITMTMSEAYRIYADELGKSTANLTDAEKQQAALNLALERGAEALNRTNAEIDPLTQQYEEAKTNIVNAGIAIGQFLLKVGEPYLYFLNQSADGLEKINNKLKEQAKYYEENPLENTMMGGDFITGRRDADDYATSLEDLIGTTVEITAAMRQQAYYTSRNNVFTEDFAKKMGFASLATYEAYLGISEYVDAQQRLEEQMSGSNKAVEDALKALQAEAEEAKKLAELQDELIQATAELNTQYTNLERAIRFASGEIDYYNEAVDTSNWTNQTAITVYTQLSNSLPSLQRRYDMLGKEVNKYSRQISVNTNAMEANRAEYDAITQAMKIRQMLAVSQLDEEINKLKLLGAQQGYLTFDQRRRLNALEEEKSQTEDAVEATTEEEKALARLDREYANLVSRNEELNNAMDKVARQYDRIGEAISTNTERMNTLVSVMTEYLRLLSQAQNLASKIGDGAEVGTGASQLDTGGKKEASAKEYRYVHSLDGKYATDWYSTWGEAREARRNMILPENYPESWIPQERIVKAARGFFGSVARPTLFLAGEAGKEHVSITPSGKSSPSSNQISVTINVNGGIGDTGERRNAAREMSDVFIDELQKRGVKLY